MDTAKKNGVMLRFEASVGGGIPILGTLTGPLRANRFEEVLGILNGTTNYILTMMTKEGLDYDTALKDAQAQGFAEADPTADVEGIDAANKLSILIALMFGKYVAPGDIQMCIRDRCYCFRSSFKRRHFEHACRPVPYDRLCLRYTVLI